MRAGDVVAAGARLGPVRNLYGDVLEEIVAPEDGVVLFLTSSPAVDADGLLLGLGADLARDLRVRGRPCGRPSRDRSRVVLTSFDLDEHVSAAGERAVDLGAHAHRGS